MWAINLEPSTSDVGDMMDPNPVVDSEIENDAAGHLENPRDAVEDELSVHQPASLTRAR